MKFAILLFSFLLVFLAFTLILPAHASYIKIESPVEATLHNNSTVYLGKVGPGESFYIDASPNTTNASGKLIPAWGLFKAVSLPNGWSSQQSLLYANPLELKITVAPNATNGTYKMVLQAVNLGNYLKMGSINIIAYIEVTRDVFEANITNPVVMAGVGQPANLHVLLNNTGASDVPFVIFAKGLPSFNYTYLVIAKKGIPVSFNYPVYENEPGTYHFKLFITASSSPLVNKSYSAELIVNSSISNDYSASGRGFLVSPIIYEPVYAIMYLITKLAGIV